MYIDFSKEELKNQFDDIQIGKINRFKNNTFSSESNRKYLLELFVDKLFQDNIITDINEIPSIINYKLFERYKIHKMLSGYFNNSPANAMLFLFPDKWESWMFNNTQVPSGTWNNKNNIVNAIKDLVYNKLKIESIEEIYSINSKHFKKYKLESILNIYHYNISKIFQDVFPEYELLTWKFKVVPIGYWDNKKNRINALKELIEKELKIDIIDIKNVITIAFLKNNYSKFYNVYKKYYNNGIYNWINEVYPNVFTKDEFYSLCAKDGIILKSKEELKIHNLFLKLNYKVKYFSNDNSKKDKLYNEKYNENYIPDWLLNDHIIVEYFGLYTLEPKTNFSIKYVERTHRKIEFYQKYCKNNPQYIFIALFPEDLNDNLKGIKNKLQ